MRRDLLVLFWVLDGDLGLEEAHQRVDHAHGDAKPGTAERNSPSFSSWTKRIATAVTKMLSSAIGRSHFQAKPISWSIAHGQRASHPARNEHEDERLGEEPEEPRTASNAEGPERIAPRRGR